MAAVEGRGGLSSPQDGEIIFLDKREGQAGTPLSRETERREHRCDFLCVCVCVRGGGCVGVGVRIDFAVVVLRLSPTRLWLSRRPPPDTLKGAKDPRGRHA